VSLDDIEAIRQLKARYFRYVDTKQWSCFGDLFTEEAILDVPLVRKEPLRGRTAIVGAVSRNLGNLVTIHQGHVEEIEILDRNRARAIWPMSDLLLAVTVPLTPTTARNSDPGDRYQGSGEYIERYERGADGRWRISRCELRRLHLETEHHLLVHERRPGPRVEFGQIRPVA